MWAKVQVFVLTMYPIFTYFTGYQVEIHGPAKSSDVLRVTFACKREYFLRIPLEYHYWYSDEGGKQTRRGQGTKYNCTVS